MSSEEMVDTTWKLSDGPPVPPATLTRVLAYELAQGFGEDEEDVKMLNSVLLKNVFRPCGALTVEQLKRTHKSDITKCFATTNGVLLPEMWVKTLSEYIFVEGEEFPCNLRSWNGGSSSDSGRWSRMSCISNSDESTISSNSNHRCTVHTDAIGGLDKWPSWYFPEPTRAYLRNMMMSPVPNMQLICYKLFAFNYAMFETQYLDQNFKMRACSLLAGWCRWDANTLAATVTTYFGNVRMGRSLPNGKLIFNPKDVNDSIMNCDNKDIANRIVTDPEVARLFEFDFPTIEERVKACMVLGTRSFTPRPPVFTCPAHARSHSFT